MHTQTNTWIYGRVELQGKFAKNKNINTYIYTYMQTYVFVYIQMNNAQTHMITNKQL